MSTKNKRIEINREKVEFKEEIPKEERQIRKLTNHIVLPLIIIFGFLKKFWNFVWNDDSIWSWIISLILAFIVIKFIFFPLLSLILGSSMPLVVVESSSMHHNGFFISNWFQTQSKFDLFWNEKGLWYDSYTNITKEQAEDWPIRGGFEKGDIIVLIRTTNLDVGDIIVFEAKQKHPVIHRIIKISQDSSGRTVYSTKGDNNEGQLSIEKQISEEQLIGKAFLVIPKLGWVKLIFVEIINAFS